MSLGTSKTIDIDKVQEKFLKELGKIHNSFITIGVHKDAKPYPDGTSVQKVALINEFGTDKIPERSFVRSTFDASVDEKQREAEIMLNNISIGRSTARKTLITLGFKDSQRIETTIEKIKTPPNTESTVKGKPYVGNNPLIDSRHLKQSVYFKIKKRRRPKNLFGRLSRFL